MIDYQNYKIQIDILLWIILGGFYTAYFIRLTLYDLVCANHFMQVLLKSISKRWTRNIDVGISELFYNLINVVSVYHIDRI